MKTNSFFLTSLHETDSYMMMFVYERESQAFTEPDSLCGGSFMLHALTDLGCLRLSTSLPTLLHSPLSSLFSCPLPVIACQINVPLCSHAQKLSCHIQPLLPFLSFFFLIWFLLHHHHHLHLLWSIFPPCAHIHFLFSSHVHPCVFSLLFSPVSGFLTPCCLSSSVPSLERGRDSSSISIYFRRCVFVLPRTNVAS